MYYKNVNDKLIKGERIVNKNYELIPNEKTSSDEWHWFESEEEAYSFFKLKKPIAEKKDVRNDRNNILK